MKKRGRVTSFLGAIGYRLWGIGYRLWAIGYWLAEAL